jgi:hypothetical protein
MLLNPLMALLPFNALLPFQTCQRAKPLTASEQKPLHQRQKPPSQPSRVGNLEGLKKKCRTWESPTPGQPVLSTRTAAKACLPLRQAGWTSSERVYVLLVSYSLSLPFAFSPFRLSDLRDQKPSTARTTSLPAGRQATSNK